MGRKESNKTKQKQIPKCYEAHEDAKLMHSTLFLHTEIAT